MLGKVPFQPPVLNNWTHTHTHTLSFSVRLKWIKRNVGAGMLFLSSVRYSASMILYRTLEKAFWKAAPAEQGMRGKEFAINKNSSPGTIQENHGHSCRRMKMIWELWICSECSVSSHLKLTWPAWSSFIFTQETSISIQGCKLYN